jgi:SSS family solute:Na+ symporter
LVFFHGMAHHLIIHIAILLKDHASLIAVMDRKFDLLVQLVPAFIISLHYKFLSAKPVFYGLLFGVLISLVLAFIPFSFIENGKFYGFHPGVVALPINILIATIGSLKSGLKPFKYT